MSGTPESAEVPASEGFIGHVINEIISSPLNLALIGVIALLIYKIIKSRIEVPHSHEEPKDELPRLRRDFTPEELLKYDGTQPDGRVLMAILGYVYDVTKGKRFYGPGGPYEVFAGRDASRGLATFSVSRPDNVEYDDLSDLSTMEMDSVREWEMQFKEKYPIVGRLLKPGEEPSTYSDDEEETPADAAASSQNHNKSD